MSYFLQAFLLTLKQQLRSWRTWLMVLLLPALIFAVDNYVPKEELSAPVQVGVCLPDDGGEAFWEHLSDRSDAVITFLQADENTIREKVATGQWDCGLLLAQDFDLQLKTLKTDKLITLYISPASTVYPLVQETAACAVMELLSADIARDYVQRNNISQNLAHMENLTDAQQVRIGLQTLSGGALQVQDLAQQTASNLLHGCIGLLLLIWALFSAMDLGSWYASAAAMRMTMVRSPAALLLPRAMAALTPALLSALCGSIILRGTPATVSALLAYLLTLVALTLLLSRCRPVWTALPCLMPFIAVLALLFSPMIFDVSALLPALAPLCTYLPLSLYLNACNGSLTALGILLLEGAALLLLFLLTASSPHRRKQ